MRTIYFSEDGKRFDSEDECKKYEEESLVKISDLKNQKEDLKKQLENLKKEAVELRNSYNEKVDKISAIKKKVSTIELALEEYDASSEDAINSVLGWLFK